jgi:hypothetical protein
MIAVTDPNMIIAGLAAGGLLLVGMWRLIAWVREAPVKPDPWDAEVEKQLADPDTPQVCPHCLTEQPPTAWFCACCGSAVGPYNNLMPYVQVFSEGEVFRNGVSGRFRNRPLIIIGYMLIMLGMAPFLAPIYLLVLLSNSNRQSGRQEPSEEQNLQQ